MEGILNLCMCPVQFTRPYLNLNQSITVGNVITPVSADQLTQPYKRFNMGTIYLNEFYGNYADYSPYTKVSIYLPYIGVVPLDIDDLMNGGVNLWANCDVFSGAIQYFLFSAQANHRNHGHQSVLYSWSGNMKYNMPVAGSDFNRVLIGSITDTVTSCIGMVGGNLAKPNGGNNALAGGLSTAVGILGMGSNSTIGKSHVSRGSTAGGLAGSLGTQYAYLILERPEQTMAENYEHTLGEPNEKTDYLINYSGYIKVKGVHMEIANASADELTEIENLLKAGVII